MKLLKRENKLKCTSVLLLLFLSTMLCYTQPDSALVRAFRNLQKQELDEHYYAKKDLNFDFLVVDSIQFRKKALEKDIYISNPKPTFELKNEKGEQVQLTLNCTNKDLEHCPFHGEFYSIYYWGVSQRTDFHVLYEVREIGSLYLIDPINASVISVPCSHDPGYIPVFMADYLLLYSSVYYDGLESIITVYQLKDYEGKDLQKRFQYIGSFTSSNWVIEDIHESVNDKSFLMKIRDKNENVAFLEMTINE